MRPFRDSGPATPNGFTIFELLVVLTLIGITAAIVIPKLDLLAIRVNATSRSLVTFVAAAQQRAILSQRNVLVLFDSAGRRITLHEDTDNDGVADAGERSRVLELESGVLFTRGSSAAGPPGDSVLNMRNIGARRGFVFRRNGSASESAGFYIGTERQRGSARYASDVRAFTLDRGTGRLTRWIVRSGQWQRETP